jgi:type VI secretion system protein ImpC
LTQRGLLSYPIFESSRALKKVDNYDDPDAALEAELSARLSYLLPATRFVHYLKCLVRDKIGSFAGPDDVQRWLNHWIMAYVNGDPENSSPRVRASRPIASAVIIVVEDRHDPNHYACEIYLTPWYQVEDAPRVTVDMTTQLPSSRPA